MPRPNAPPSARGCRFANSPAGSGRSHSLAPYERRERRETTRRQPNDSSRPRGRRPARATGRARPRASAAPARSPATTDRPAPRRWPDESGCEDSPATPPATARAHAARASAAVRTVDQSRCTDMRARRDDSREHCCQRTITRRATAAPAHDRSIRTSPGKRRKVRPHCRHTATQGDRSRPAHLRLRRSRLEHHHTQRQHRPRGPVRSTRARTRAHHPQRCQPQPNRQRGDPKTPPQPQANTSTHTLHDSQLSYTKKARRWVFGNERRAFARKRTDAIFEPKGVSAGGFLHTAWRYPPDAGPACTAPAQGRWERV